MKRVSVLGNDPLLADAIASRLAAEISPAAIHVTHHEFDREEHSSLVMILEEGKPGSESIFCCFYASPIKTQEREKRDVANFIWACCRV
jgi:hypothetical protein